MRKHISKSKLMDHIDKVKYLKRAFDEIGDHVVITDKDANILYANKAAEKATGFSIEEMIGKNPADLWGGNMPIEFYKDMWHKIKDLKEPFVGEVRNKRKDGTERWQELHISSILDRKGNTRFFIAIEPDITDRKKKEKFREEFISIVGHQLRNPITAINWALDWLFKEGGGFTEWQYKTLQEIYGHNKDLSGLVGDLLILSRVEKNGTKAGLIDLGDEIKAIISATKKRFAAISLSLKKEGDVFVVNTNKKTSAQQIFQNIITNAVEYSDRNSGQVEVGLKKNKSGYIFSCKDNGIGIPKEDQPKIFGRFFRASNAEAVKKSGTGLGLFIAKMIADDLGWEISFESEVGKGTTFFVKIPIKK